MIKINSISKSFGHKKVLKNISLEIGKGEKIVLLGPSGCGKTTLLRILSTLETFEMGSILVDGIPLENISPITQKITMLFQSFNLFPHMNVMENILFAPQKIQKKKPQKLREKAEKLIQDFELTDQRNQYPKTLSGGQKQRVAIARAMILETPILLFDEPTSALDPEMSKEVLINLEKVSQANKTILCVTHEIEFARHFADKIAFIKDGVLIAFEKTPSFFKNPDKNIQNFLATYQ